MARSPWLGRRGAGRTLTARLGDSRRRRRAGGRCASRTVLRKQPKRGSSQDGREEHSCSGHASLQALVISKLSGCCSVRHPVIAVSRAEGSGKALRCVAVPFASCPGAQSLRAGCLLGHAGQCVTVSRPLQRPPAFQALAPSPYRTPVQTAGQRMRPRRVVHGSTGAEFLPGARGA